MPPGGGAALTGLAWRAQAGYCGHHSLAAPELLILTLLWPSPSPSSWPPVLDTQPQRCLPPGTLWNIPRSGGTGAAPRHAATTGMAPPYPVSGRPEGGSGSALSSMQPSSNVVSADLEAQATARLLEDDDGRQLDLERKSSLSGLRRTGSQSAGGQQVQHLRGCAPRASERQLRHWLALLPSAGLNPAAPTPVAVLHCRV